MSFERKVVFQNDLSINDLKISTGLISSFTQKGKKDKKGKETRKRKRKGETKPQVWKVLCFGKSTRTSGIN